MDFLPQQIQDPAIPRRIVFAVAYLPKNLPHYWSVVTEFVSQASQYGQQLQPEAVKVAMKNLQVVNDKAFTTDKQLIYEIHALSPTFFCHSPLGIVLRSIIG